MLREEHSACFDDYARAWNDQDLPRVMAQFAADGVYDDPVLPGPSTGDDIEAYFASTLEGFPDLTFEREVYETQADDVLINDWTGTATHTGFYFDLPPTGRSVVVEGVGVIRFSADGLAQVTNYFDQQSIRRQLGLDFPAVIGQVPRLLYLTLKRRL